MTHECVHVKMGKLPICVIFLGTVLLISFAVIHWVVQPLFSGEQVVQGMRAFYGPFGSVDHWQKFGLPTYLALDPALLHVYLFNVTNPQDVVRDGIKPILQQVGPYVYFTEKIIAEIPMNDTATISFKETTIYHFSPEHSGQLSENDLVIALNVPFLKTVSALEKLPRQNSIFTSLILSGEGQETVFIQRPVRELLLDGFSQPALEKAQKLLGRHSSQIFQNGQFRFLYHGNGSESKPYVISASLTPTQTPEGVEVDYSQIITYDGEAELNYWAKTEEGKCNQISGTPDGTLFKPLGSQGLSLSVFRPEICRSVRFHFNGVVEPYDGLTAYRFTLGRELLLDSSADFENNCFCPNPGVEIPSCLEQGTLSNCRDGGVFYVTTLPHFLDSPMVGKPFLTQVVGLRPNRALHESFIDLEPITGLALKSSLKLQLNYELVPSGGHEDLKNIPQMLFPILWTDEVKSMNMIVKQAITQNIMKPFEIMEYSKWVLAVFGVILTTAGFLICIVRQRKKKYPIYLNTMILSGQDSQSVRSLSALNRKSSFRTSSKPLGKRSASADAVYSRERASLTKTKVPSLLSSRSVDTRLEMHESVL